MFSVSLFNCLFKGRIQQLLKHAIKWRDRWILVLTCTDNEVILPQSPVVIATLEGILQGSVSFVSGINSEWGDITIYCKPIKESIVVGNKPFCSSVGTEIRPIFSFSRNGWPIEISSILSILLKFYIEFVTLCFIVNLTSDNAVVIVIRLHFNSKFL